VRIASMSSCGIVILNFNSPEDTIRLTRSLLHQEGVSIKIVIVDNGSDDDSYNRFKDIAKLSDKITVIRNDYNSGYAVGNNIGLKFLSEVDYKCIINPDVIVSDAHLIHKLIELYETLKDVAFIAPSIKHGNKVHICEAGWNLPDLLDETKTFLLLTRRRHFKNDREIIKVDCVSGSFFLGRSDIFDRLNYLDEGTFLYNEETILGYKVKKYGFSNYVATRLSYEHIGSKSINSLFNVNKKYYLLFKSKVYYWRSIRGNRLLMPLALLFLLLVNQVILVLKTICCNIWK